MKKSVMLIMAAIAMLIMSCKGGSSSGEGTAEATDVPEYEKLDERAALVKIFEAVGGEEWSDYNKAGWCTSASGKM